MAIRHSMASHPPSASGDAKSGAGRRVGGVVMVRRKEFFLFGSTRQCPSCGNIYPTTVEEGPLYWGLMKTIRSVDTGELDEDGDPVHEQREIGVPGTFCKKCESKRVADGRRLRREIAKLPPDERIVAEIVQLGGYCDCCHERKRRGQRTCVQLGDSTYGLCEICRSNCGEADGDYRAAGHKWLVFARHCQREEWLNAMWLTVHDRRRTYHSVVLVDADGSEPRWRRATPDDYAGLPLVHFTCKWTMRAWKNTYHFLAREARRFSNGLA
jgi:hypothetical protein